MAFCRGKRDLQFSVSVVPSVGSFIGPYITLDFMRSLKVEKFRYEYFMDITAPAQIITAPAQLITAPAQLITAPAQPPATGVVVYTALFIHSFINLFVSSVRIKTLIMLFTFFLHSSNLRTATPATVSRAGILYINPQDLGWNP